MALGDRDQRTRRLRAHAGDLVRMLQSSGVAEGAEAGLRERKKAQLRQQISDTATMLFIERGFDAVKVSEIAAACDVSEKTVFNYFPTKESLLFDNTDRIAETIRESVRDHRDGRSITAATHAAVVSEFERMHGYWRTADGDAVLDVVRRFVDLIAATPALQAAQHAMLERFVAAAAEALAERAGVDPDDPEPQIAGLAVAGLWRVQYVSMQRHVHTVATVDELRAAVLADLDRAARITESGLSSFDAAITTGRRGPGAAAAADDARRHVVAAVRHAREAWRAAREAHEAMRPPAPADPVAALKEEVERYRIEAKRLRRLGDDTALRRESARHRAEIRRLKEQMRAGRAGR